MTTSSIKVAPPNSLVLISDVNRGEVPEEIDPELGFGATASSIAVACLPDMDGETMIKLGPAAEVDPGSRPAFEMILATPTRTVAVMTIEWAVLLKTGVPASSTRVRVWTDRAKWPSNILIGLG
jgi:hypothetical protein